MDYIWVIVLGIIIAVLLIGTVVYLALKRRKYTKKKNSEADYAESNAADEETVLLRKTNDPKKARIRLTYERDQERGFYAVLDPSVTIGRKKECDIHIDDDRAISLKHCTIYYQDGSVYLEDQNSSNGTYVNDIQVLGAIILETGDIIEIGRTRLIVSF